MGKINLRILTAMLLGWKATPADIDRGRQIVAASAKIKES
tara:strand:- start:176 stop:295 length:120 start_codon:yes stop_codon:yes gene_type:complete